MSEIDFEEQLEEAKKILNKLTDPNITLSNSVKLYKEGMEKLKVANQLLDEAKLKYEQYQQNSDKTKEE